MERITATIKSTGETFVLCDGKKYMNFSKIRDVFIREAIWGQFHNFNDDIMDGSKVNGWTLSIRLYRCGEEVEEIEITYPDAVEDNGR